MRATERLDLLETIGKTLQERYTYVDIDVFFNAMGISTDEVPKESMGSKRVYAKDVMKKLSEAQIMKVAVELGLEAPVGVEVASTPPANWRDTKQFRLFISHISKDKLIATKLKDALAQHAIAGFVAHEDILPTLPWQEEIERGLNTMDAMVAIHTEGFSASFWTQQEIGFALGRNVKVISFKFGEDPTGFIQKHQALPKRGRNADQIAEEVRKLLVADSRTTARMLESFASQTTNSHNDNSIIDKIGRLRFD